MVRWDLMKLINYNFGTKCWLNPTNIWYTVMQYLFNKTDFIVWYDLFLFEISCFFWAHIV